MISPSNQSTKRLYNGCVLVMNGKNPEACWDICHYGEEFHLDFGSRDQQVDYGTVILTTEQALYLARSLYHAAKAQQLWEHRHGQVLEEEETV